MNDSARLLVPLSAVEPAQILVVDGNATSRHRLSRIIKNGGHLVHRLERGASALAATRSRRPDLVVCEDRLPDVTGLQLLDQLRSIDGCAELPFLLIARVGGAESRLAALEQGVSDILTEPIDRSELLLRLRNHLRIANDLRRWREVSFMDPLTGLLNRRGILHCMHREIEQARRSQKALSVLFLDLDGFKAINDRYGHRVGDEVLKDAARVVAATIRAGDSAARLGGDEFLVVLPGLERGAARRIALRIERRFNQAARHGQGVRASIGIATTLAIQGTAAQICEELLGAADEEMYGCKRHHHEGARSLAGGA